MLSAMNSREPWQDAWDEEQQNNEEAFREFMNDYYERERELIKSHDSPAAVTTDFADAWKRGKH